MFLLVGIRRLGVQGFRGLTERSTVAPPPKTKKQENMLAFDVLSSLGSLPLSPSSLSLSLPLACFLSDGFRRGDP